MEPIEPIERPKVGEDIDKPLFPDKLPQNPTLVTETFWNSRTDRRETINHELYRKLSFAGGISLALSLGGTVAGAITGNWELAAASFGIGTLLGKITQDISTDYNQKLKDAGHPYVRTRDIK